MVEINTKTRIKSKGILSLTTTRSRSRLAMISTQRINLKTFCVEQIRPMKCSLKDEYRLKVIVTTL